MNVFDGPRKPLLFPIKTAQELYDLVFPAGSLTRRKVEEMVRRGFTHEDETFRAMFYAMNDLYRLAVKLHHETCQRSDPFSVFKVSRESTRKAQTK